MNRKKFFSLFSTGVIGIALLKANPLKIFTTRKENRMPIEVKMNPDAVKREKSGKKNG